MLDYTHPLQNQDVSTNLDNHMITQFMLTIYYRIYVDMYI